MTEREFGGKVMLVRDDLKAMGIEVSNTTLLRWEYLGRFPRRLRLAGTTVCWLAREIDGWIKERTNERATRSYSEY